MKIGIYGKVFPENSRIEVQELLDTLLAEGIELLFFETFYKSCIEKVNIPKDLKTFSEYGELKNKVDYVISIGGDGTLLDTLCYIGDSGIPVLGVNTGRLGFLTSTSKNDTNKR